MVYCGIFRTRAFRNDFQTMQKFCTKDLLQKDLLHFTMSNIDLDTQSCMDMLHTSVYFSECKIDS